MAAVANIGDASAQTFAEYVPTEPLPDPIFPPQYTGPNGDTARVDGKLPRPPLPYRIYSHRLRVQAHAKNERARLLSGPLVDVFVGAGDNRRQWSLHRNLLSYHSEYLASELQTNDATKNKAGNRLELPEDDPKGFELLVKWLYQGKIEDVSDIADDNAKYEFAVACHKLYVLCERFDMPQLKNMAIDKYRKGLKQARLVPDAEEINEIYQKSPEGSPFRALMTKIAARQIMDPDSDRDANSYRSCFENNPDFAIDLVNAIKAGTGGMLFDDPTSGDECEYHDHEDGPNCHNKGKGKEAQAQKQPLGSRASVPNRHPRHQKHHQKHPSKPPIPTQPQVVDESPNLRQRLLSSIPNMVSTAAKTAAVATQETALQQQTPSRQSQDPLSPESDLSLLEEEARNGIHRSLGGGAPPLPNIPYRGMLEFERGEIGVA